MSFFRIYNLIFFRTDQTFVFDKNNEIDHHAILSFHEKSTNESEIQHQIPSNSQPHVDSKTVYIFFSSQYVSLNSIDCRTKVVINHHLAIVY